MHKIDIPLLDRKALQLYKIYFFDVYQNFSENYTGAAYITLKKQFSFLTQDERKLFIADDTYHDSCQKTIFYTICENSQPICEILTTTYCECLMLARPSMKIWHQCYNTPLNKIVGW